MHESWMDYGPLDATGWPLALPHPEPERMTRMVGELLAKRPMGVMDLYQSLRSDPCYRELLPTFSATFKTWDSILYTVDRAARAANARRVYVVES